MSAKILIALLLAIGGGALLWPWASQTAEAKAVSGDVFHVRRGDLPVAITENGTMVAKESQKITAKIESQSKILSLVEEGKQVAEGDEICKLDDAEVKKQVEQVEMEILTSEANLKSARTELEIQQVENQANLAKAKVALERATKEVEKYRDGEAPQERRKLEIALKDAQTEFNRKKKDLEDSQNLLKQNYIKKSELEDHQIAFERAQVQKEGAEVALQMFDKYTFPMAMTDLQTKLADADRDVANAEKRGESTLGQEQVAQQQAEKRLKMQQEQLGKRKEDLDHMVLKAPCPGIVVYGDPHDPWYRERIKVGGEIYGGFTVMTIPDLREMQVKLQIHEADISKLKLTLPATITTDSYPGLSLEGTVTKIASVANSGNDWSGNTEVKKFDVEVTVTPPKDIQLRPGISAKCVIHVENRQQTLFVPLQSVFAEGGSQWCHVQVPDKPPEKRAIKLGTSNDTYVEILEGLAEGDAVLLYNPSLPDARDKDDAAKAPDKPGTTAETKTTEAKADTAQPAKGS